MNRTALQPFEKTLGRREGSGPKCNVPATGCSRPGWARGCNPAAGTLSERTQSAYRAFNILTI